MKVFVCGGLGFAGQYLVYGLLKQGHELIVLARDKETKTLDQRMKELVANNDLVNDFFRIDKGAFDNVTMLDGDLSADNFGLSDKDLRFLLDTKIDEIYNLAACLRYEQKYRDQCQKTNVEGTRKLLDLALRNNSRYIHTSTAYITGCEVKSGEVIQEKYYDSKEFVNVYIESKAQGESLVRAYKNRYNMNCLIFRLPTLIGDSKTGFTNSVFGIYEYFWAFSVLRKKVTNEDKIRVQAAPDGTVNLLPTDIVIKCMLRICEAELNSNYIFNLTDKEPFRPAELCGILGNLFGLPPTEVKSNFKIEKDGSRIDRLFARLTQKNSGFARHVYKFDSSNSESHLGHPVAQEWRKSKQYFDLLKKGYESYVSTLH